MRARDNPFAAARLDRIPFQFPPELTWRHLLDQLATLNYRAALVGPEGSGKTTLLQELAGQLAERGFAVRSLRLDVRQRRIPIQFWADLSIDCPRRRIIFLDGAEQLSRWHWWRFCRHIGRLSGLVITTHRPGRLPVLLTCRTTPELLAHIVRGLLRENAELSPGSLQDLFLKHQGNLRLALRELYDRFADLEASLMVKSIKPGPRPLAPV
jgi:hypothetical protein